MKSARIHIVYFCMLLCLGVLPKQSLADNEVTYIAKESGEYSWKMLYMETARRYEANEYFEKAIIQYQLALQLAQKNSDQQSITELNFHLGHLFNKLSVYQQALECYFIALESHYIEKDKQLKAKTVRRIASVYQSIGEFETSYDYQLQALQLSEAIADSASIATSYYELGTIFFYQERYQQALEHYQKARHTFGNDSNPTSMYACLAAIGSAYERLGQIELALDYNVQSLKLAEKIEYKTGIAYAAHNIGSNYTLKENYDRALGYLVKSMQLKLDLKDKWGLIGTYRSIALVHIRSGKIEYAKDYLGKALELAKQIDTKSRISEIYKSYADAYKRLNQHEEAYEYLIKYVAVKDSVLSEATLKQMGEKKSLYEIQKREAEINLLKKQQELYQKENQINKLYKYILFGSALFFLLIIRLLYSRYKLQRQSNALLEEKNSKIKQQNDQLELANAKRKEANALLESQNSLLEEKNEQIRLQNSKLETSNEDLKQFAYVASHDLKEPLRMISSYTTLLKKRYSGMFDENAAEFMGFIIDAVGRMETLLSDLLSYSRVNTQQQVFELIDSARLIEIVVSTLHFKIREKNVKLLIDYSEFPKIQASRSQMMQLFQNLISNAIKFTNEQQPQLAVGYRKTDEGHLYFVKDNGIGIAEEDQGKIFEMFRRLHTQDEFEGSGIGLSTCKKIVEKHHGEIWLESTKGSGSTFFFRIPLNLAELQSNLLVKPKTMLPN